MSNNKKVRSRVGDMSKDLDDNDLVVHTSGSLQERRRVLKCLENFDNACITAPRWRATDFHFASSLANLNAIDFNYQSFLSSLKAEQMGRIVLSRKSTDSTQSAMMDFLSSGGDLPLGSCYISEFQTSGRGRGRNNWNSPPGCLSFSLYWRIPRNCGSKLIFVQYLAALSVIEGIKKSKNCGAVRHDVRIKWPNDIYLGTQTQKGNEENVSEYVHKYLDKYFLKIGGVLCNVISGDDPHYFNAVIGFGLNVKNETPTTCLQSKISNLTKEYICREDIFANILNSFEPMLAEFCHSRDAELARLMDEYLSCWMHQDAEVEAHIFGSEPEESVCPLKTKVVIKGISKAGFLLAQNSVGEFYELHPDRNSFDMMRGLISKKV